MKHLLKLLDLSCEEITRLLDLGDRLKKERADNIRHPYLAGKALHGVLAAVFAYLLYPLSQSLFPAAAAVSLSIETQISAGPFDSALETLKHGTALFARAFIASALTATVIYILFRVKGTGSAKPNP